MMTQRIEAGTGPLVTYTLFPNAFPIERVERADVPWHDLCAKIHDAPTYISKRHCPLISIAAYGDRLTENNCIRHADNVLRVYGIEIDYDGEEITPEEGAKRLAAANLMAIVYTSPSHVDGAPRWRALLPLSEPAAPSLRIVYVARANRALGGLATRESFTLSQSFYIGKVRGGTYRVIETDGRCIDLAADLEPLYYTGHATNAVGRDMRSDAELRQAFDRGEGRYEAMLKLSSRWAARGMEADDIASALLELLGNAPLNAEGIDLRSRIEPLAMSAVAKFGDTRRPAPRELSVSDLTPPEEDAPPVELPPVEVYADEVGEPVPAVAAGEITVLRPLHEIVAEQREPEWLLDDVLEANVLAVLAGPRGTFKSFVALDWSMRIAAAGISVVILSGEGAGLDRRADAWVRTHGGGRTIDEFPVFALERAMNLNAELDLIQLKGAIERLGHVPGLVVVDTFSKFAAGLDENDNGEVSTYLARLSKAIRESYGSTVLLVAHSGHGDSARPRGASALMANPDAEYIINRPVPTGMHVSVSRERFKDCPALQALGYEAQVVDLGRLDKRGRPVTSLALLPSEVLVQTAKKAVGANQERALVALREYHRQNPDVRFISSIDLSALLAAQGINRKRRPEVLNWLCNASILTASIGGHTFDPNHL